MGRRKVMFPRKQAWSTRCKSATCDLKTTDVDAVRLHGSIASMPSHFGGPQYRSHLIRYPVKLATLTGPFNGDGGSMDPVPAREMHPAPAQSPALQEPSASAGQVIA
jgi:hypothetical protein